MTIQEAYKKITSSEDLKKKAMEALKAGKADEFLKEQGIDFTVDQIKDYLQRKKSGELSKAELDMATGGCGEIITEKNKTIQSLNEELLSKQNQLDNIYNSKR